MRLDSLFPSVVGVEEPGKNQTAKTQWQGPRQQQGQPHRPFALKWQGGQQSCTKDCDDLSAFSRGEGPGEPVRLMSRLARAGVTDGLDISSRKPDWIRPKVSHGDDVLAPAILAELKAFAGDRGPYPTFESFLPDLLARLGSRGPGLRAGRPR